MCRRKSMQKELVFKRALRSKGSLVRVSGTSLRKVCCECGFLETTTVVTMIKTEDRSKTKPLTLENVLENGGNKPCRTKTEQTAKTKGTAKRSSDKEGKDAPW